jgi:F-type H+-transporting ATPase subunit delta
VSVSSEARTYAGVAFETALKGWIEGLGAVIAAFSRNPNLRNQLADPGKSFQAKEAMLQGLLPQDTPNPARNFLLAMVANGDISLLDEVFDELNQMAAAGGGPRPTVAEVTSAIELTGEERQAIQNRLVDQFGPNLEFRFKVDEGILGGLIIRVGDKLMDISLASRMAALRQSLGKTTG